MRPFLKTIGLVFGAFLGFQVVIRIIRKSHPFPVPHFMNVVLELPTRRFIQDPAEMMDRVGIAPGMQVLELGPGPGFFTPEASRRVGPEGRLYCIDIEPAMIEKVQDKVRQHGLTNVVARVGNAYALPFADGALELAFLISVFGEIPDKQRALKELHRVLKPGGVLSVSEALPDPDYSLSNSVIKAVEEAGFRLLEQKGSFFSYTVNFLRP